MYPPKAPFITQDLERKIRMKEYTDTIPSARVLANLYGTAKQTVTKALIPLKESGLISTKHGCAPVIHRRKLKKGSIVLVNYEGEKDWMNYGNRLLKQIREEGFSTVFLRKSSGDPALHTLPSDTAGCLFANSSLTVEDAEYLDKQQIPFVSCNDLPSYPRLNMVDFDFKDICRNFLQRAVGAKRYRVGMFFAGHLEGFNTMMHSTFMQMKRKMGLPKVACDDLITDWSTSTEKIVRKTLHFLKESSDYPDLLISFNGFDPAIRSLFRDIPEDMIVVVKQSVFEEDKFPRFLYYTSDCSPDDLWCSGYELLREAMFTPGIKIRRTLRPDYNFDSPIPIKEEKL